QMNIKLSKPRSEPIGIIGLPYLGTARNPQAVGVRLLPRHHAGEKAVIVYSRQSRCDARRRRLYDFDGLRSGKEDSDGKATVVRAVHTEHREGIGVPTLDDSFDIGPRRMPLSHTDTGWLGTHALASRRVRSSRIPRSGIESHAGRFAAS